MVEASKGFLGRWAHRKTEALKGNPLEEPVRGAKTEASDAATGRIPLPGAAQPPSPAAGDSVLQELPAEQALSLDDVKHLTKDSDFKPFMAGNVGPEVRNAAMKKLFADPHFNVMDGLDIYIDDYSKADPIPESMLRQMVGSKFLKLFDDEEDGESGLNRNDAPSLSGESSNNLNTETVAQSLEYPDIAPSDPVSLENSSPPKLLPDSGGSPQDHADSHLRLQPDHAPEAPDPGRGTS
ncbi:MAG: DUF3306 domain-containing protein [Polaromonas sp.]|uniref:DUF3306 domain-containing protein n=1 Tax=Polaromonas sp. TaxID=1869339 RepID=UPI00179AE70C|nr:DUF3306 domain-containing protein [Polaromonas sp.]NMM10416.1 DUF3306 domain-containing protein [Polaromonas sp.]